MNNLKLKDRLNSKVQNIDERKKSMEETALIEAESNYVALKNNTIEIIKENLKNQPLSFQLFDIVKSPSGGSTVFSVPGLSGDEAAKELTGIILDYTMPRAYWDTPDPVEGTPPVCSSSDSVISHDGKPCATCPFNDFGSKIGDSNAKACKSLFSISACADRAADFSPNDGNFAQTYLMYFKQNCLSLAEKAQVRCVRRDTEQALRNP